MKYRIEKTASGFIVTAAEYRSPAFQSVMDTGKSIQEMIAEREKRFRELMDEIKARNGDVDDVAMALEQLAKEFPY